MTSETFGFRRAEVYEDITLDWDFVFNTTTFCLETKRLSWVEKPRTCKETYVYFFFEVVLDIIVKIPLKEELDTVTVSVDEKSL